MKKILGLTVAALLVMGLVGGGTWAYFSDPEVTGNNILTAGTLDLDLGPGDGDEEYPVIVDFSTANIAPGQSDNGSVELNYPSTNIADGELDILFSSWTHVGLASGGNDEYGDDSGDLGANVQLAVYIDVDGSTDYTDGTDIGLESGTPGVYTSGDLQWFTLASYAGDNFTDVYSAASVNGTADNFTIEWRIDPSIGNTIQGDSANCTVTFLLQQAAAD